MSNDGWTDLLLWMCLWTRFCLELAAALLVGVDGSPRRTAFSLFSLLLAGISAARSGASGGTLGHSLKRPNDRVSVVSSSYEFAVALYDIAHSSLRLL